MTANRDGAEDVKHKPNPCPRHNLNDKGEDICCRECVDFPTCKVRRDGTVCRDCKVKNPTHSECTECQLSEVERWNREPGETLG